MVTVQVTTVPAQAPPQPTNVAPVSGEAFSVTVAFAVTFAEQDVEPRPHVIDPPVTLPLPLTETLSRKPAPLVPPEKIAVTLLAWLIRTVQVVAVPPHAPVQPVKVAPVAGVASSVTDALAAKLAEQIVAPRPQEIAPLPPLTAPFPSSVTVSVFAGTKVAVTAAPVDGTVNVQLAPEPAQAPLQLEKA